MAKNFILGGETLDGKTVNPSKGTGVYALNPGGTPKYHTGNDIRAMSTQARLFIDLPDRASFARYRQRVPERSRALVDVLSPQSSLGGVGYFDFLLQNINEAFQEKFQVAEVLSDGFVSYFFGQRAPIWNFSGALLNTQQDQWYDAFHVLYQDVLRGTRLAQNGVSLKLSYDTRVIEGALVAFNTNMSEALETAIQFNAQIVVTRMYIRNTENLRATDVAALINDSDSFTEKDRAAFTAVFGSLEAARDTSAQDRASIEDFRGGFNTKEMEERIQENAAAGYSANVGDGQSRVAPSSDPYAPPSNTKPLPATADDMSVDPMMTPAPPTTNTGNQVSIAHTPVPDADNMSIPQ